MQGCREGKGRLQCWDFFKSFNRRKFGGTEGRHVGNAHTTNKKKLQLATEKKLCGKLYPVFLPVFILQGRVSRSNTIRTGGEGIFYGLPPLFLRDAEGCGDGGSSRALKKIPSLWQQQVCILFSTVFYIWRIGFEGFERRSTPLHSISQLYRLWL